MRASAASGGRSLSQYSQLGRSSNAMASADRRGGMAEPGPVVAEKDRLDLAPHPRVVGVEPGELPRQKLLRIDEAAVERHERERLEAHHLARATRNLLERRDQHEIFQPDAVMPLAVIARLVRQDHSRLEL